jgi:hypothetical protein
VSVRYIFRLNQENLSKESKKSHITFSLAAAFSLVILTGCGGVNSSQSTTQGQDVGGVSSPTEENTVYMSPWTASKGNRGNGETISCYLTGDEKNGDLVYCQIYWSVQNTSTLPQEYYGFTYLVVDGKIIQTYEKEYAEHRTIQPTFWQINDYGSDFYIPYGGHISNLFKADSPTGIHLLDLPLDIVVY